MAVLTFVFGELLLTQQVLVVDYAGNWLRSESCFTAIVVSGSPHNAPRLTENDDKTLAVLDIKVKNN